ncbi:MAG: type II toxin-antitoxin system PemK/MazF family toxin [Saprospiraceae bacterium]|nr:type II toxin-antitoxin system PemK/MazF family toxin [Candidatus Defluviibacterium haderslevense]
MQTNQHKIVIVNLDPTIGSRIKKPSPYVVLSPNEMNHYLRTIILKKFCLHKVFRIKK